MSFYTTIWRFYLFLLLLTIEIAIATSNSDPSSLCSILSSALPGRVSLPNSTLYTASLNSYYSTQEESLLPSCILHATCTADVSTAIFVLNAAHSSKPSNGTFAIRAGGHTPFPGAANIANGITIDLSNLNSTEFLKSNKSVLSIGPGARWGAVYKFLEPHDLTVVGARGSSIGVGGFLLGGGISFLGQQLGWACDASKVIGYEVFLSSGSTVYATSIGPYSDLFLALKGGSNNFGVVTRFDLTTYNQGLLWGGFLVYSLALLKNILSSFSDFMSPVGYDPYADMIFAVGFTNPGRVQSLSLGLQDTKPIENPPVFHNLYNVSAAEFSTMRISSMFNLVTEEDTHNSYGFR